MLNCQQRNYNKKPTPTDTSQVYIIIQQQDACIAGTNQKPHILKSFLR